MTYYIEAFTLLPFQLVLCYSAKRILAGTPDIPTLRLSEAYLFFFWSTNEVTKTCLLNRFPFICPVSHDASHVHQENLPDLKYSHLTFFKAESNSAEPRSCAQKVYGLWSGSLKIAPRKNIAFLGIGCAIQMQMLWGLQLRYCGDLRQLFLHLHP